jgi:GAF domain-containing protein
MPRPDIDSLLADFRLVIETANSAEAAWSGLERLADGLFGVKLFTVTVVDMAKGVARRLYTSDPESYPVSGTKPIVVDAWFKQVVLGRQSFVRNTLAEIAEHFPDHKLIGKLGCGSVLNMPVALGGEVVGTVNCLHAEQHFTPERVAAAGHLALPALTAFLVRAALERTGGSQNVSLQ